MVMAQATNITVPGLLAFVAFNMTTVPCFAAVATAKAELPKGKFISTIAFWLIASFLVRKYGISYWDLVVDIIYFPCGLYYGNHHNTLC